MKFDIFDPRVFTAIPILATVCAMLLMYYFIWIPQSIEREQFNAKYPTHCFIERNQTIIQLNENDRVTLYHPEKVCQVLVGEWPDENNTLHYYVQYQYETQAKYNKEWHEYSLSCTPKTFDEIKGNFICTNGKIAQERQTYE